MWNRVKIYIWRWRRDRGDGWWEVRFSHSITDILSLLKDDEINNFVKISEKDRVWFKLSEDGSECGIGPPLDDLLEFGMSYGLTFPSIAGPTGRGCWPKGIWTEA